MARIAKWIKKQPVLAFYILAFLITWLGWLPQAAHSRGLFPFDSPIFYILGGVGPLLAVFIVLSVLRGEAEYGEIFCPFLCWRASVIWYGVALFGSAAIWIASLALGGKLSAGLVSVGPVLSLVPAFLTAFVAAIPEEVGWRGFALPRLQARYSALVSGLIVGALWALWHLPLLWNKNNLMSTYPILLFFFIAIARSLVYVWIFNSTRGSLLFVTLFHAASNTVGTFEGVPELIVSYVVVAVLVLVFGAAHLSRQGNRTQQLDVPVSLPQAG